MMPTKDRNVSSMYLEYKGEGILVDCGEGTQRQISIAGLKKSKVKKVLITHWHGDHVSGLIGLLQTIGNESDNPKLHIIGPKGTKERVNSMLKTCIYDVDVDLNIEEFDSEKMKKVFSNNDYEIHCVNVNHNVPCIGFLFKEKDVLNINMSKANKLGLKEGPEIRRLKEGKSIKLNGKNVDPKDVCSIKKGKSIAFMMDTSPCDGCYELAKDVDLVVSESSFSKEHQDKAEQYKHMTAEWAGQIASQSNAKKLILTHFSQRYKQVDKLLQEAKDVFPNTEAAFDFMTVKL